jgi:eukaryotic-like serine/threonine-protein kinase
MMLHLVTGLVPYEGMTEADIMAQHVRSPVPEPKEFDAALPENFCAVLRKLMAKDPAERIQSAEELVAQLSRMSSAPGGGSRSKMKPARRAVKGRRPRVAQASSIMPGVVAAIVIVAAIALTSSWQNRERASEVRSKPANFTREIAEPARTPEPVPVRLPPKKPAPSSTAAKLEVLPETAELPSLVGPKGKPEAEQ